MRKHNRMKTSTALVLALSLLLALLLSGCDALSSGGKASPAKDWDTTIDITDAFNDALEDALDDDSVKVKNFTIDVTVSVDDDGEYELTVDDRRLERTLDDVIEALLDSRGGSSDDRGSAEASEPPASLSDDRLVGNWVCSLDMTDMLYDEMESSLGDAQEYFSFHDLYLSLNLSFNSDGTVRMSVDEAALKRSLNTLIGDIMDGLKVYFDTYAQQEGIDLTLEEFLMDEYGYTMDEYANEILAEAGFDVDDIMDSVSDMNVSGTYEADGSNLTVFTSSGSNTLPYTISGSKLTLHSETGGMLGDTMVFTKK